MLKISQKTESGHILHQVFLPKVMETVGKTSYLLLDEEKGVIPRGQSTVMGFGWL